MATAPRYFYRSAVVEDLAADKAERVMGTYLTCKGIHLPSDPSPKKLAPAVRQFWDHAVAAADQHYHDRKISEKTAWKAVRLFFRDPLRSAVRMDALPATNEAPVAFIGDPGDLVRCGVCCEYTYLDAGANLVISRFEEAEAPSLYWSESTKRLLFFPSGDPARNPDVCLVPDQNTLGAKTYKRWTQRKSKCAQEVDVPEVDVILAGNCDTFVYRSDKWHDANLDKQLRGSQEYIHQVGDGVGLWYNPDAVVIAGGCLDLEERGIIH